MELDATSPVAVWVVTGSADVTTASSRRSLSAGEALWLPAGARATVRGTDGACILPIRARDEPEAGPTSAITIAVPPATRRALLSLFTRSLGPLNGDGVPAATLMSALGRSRTHVDPPRMPRSRELRRVGDTLISEPTRTLRQIAASHGMSESVMIRGFRAETGWTPARWRARRSLAGAAELIAGTGRVSAGLSATAYTSPQAFTRAFRREWGVAPSALLDRALSRTAPPSRTGDTLGPQRNGYHVVCWLAAGTARLSIDDQTVSLVHGDVACLPAGHIVGYRTEPESALIPLGWLPGGAPMSSGLIARVDDAAAPALLRLASWTYASVSPLDGGDARHALEAMLGLQEVRAAREEVTRAAYTLLEELSNDPADDASAAELARRMGVGAAELRDAIDTLTGTSLPLWRSRMRMAWARRLLREGAHATQVAHRLGYSDPASFSRAFARAHGCPPATYRRREIAERTE